ncbi:hypothetical protein CKO12_11060 [Chromatium okenii]|uniref:tetratricopeptide repeat protein n=1 Tax=Chromatium okenii TaxID=61644 RepID=UPI0019050AEE|nr:tetratricopeptide repeat protein [Chromatium okenii]MBK1642405.1 hypothetical protein [Chromatium okenii]
MNMRLIVAMLLWLNLGVSHASGDGNVTSASQLLGLPSYCRGTQQVRAISQDPTPMSVYIERYGPTYNHLHHYCWALNTENDISQRHPPDGRFWLGTAISNIDYVLHNNNDPKFIFLPEIYVAKARILFKMDQANDAVPWLEKAITLRPNYSPAYARLSDYYLEKGNKEKAIKILQQGISRSKTSEMLTRRLRDIQAKTGDSETR